MEEQPTRGTVFFLQYRGGSTVFQNYMRLRDADGNEFLPTVPEKTCPALHTNAGNVVKVANEYWNRDIAISTHIGNWWGNKPSNRVPYPYRDPSAMKWDVHQLRLLLSPSKIWKFIYLIRDGRNQVASLCNLKGGAEERLSKNNPLDYFIAQCKGFRNRARIAIDCANDIRVYRIYKFEDLIENPMDTLDTIFQFAGYKINKDFTKEQIRRVQDRVVGPNHASFKDDKKMHQRWHAWTDQQKDLFKLYAGDELVELGYEKDLNW